MRLSLKHRNSAQAPDKPSQPLLRLPGVSGRGGIKTEYRRKEKGEGFTAVPLFCCLFVIVQARCGKFFRLSDCFFPCGIFSSRNNIQRIRARIRHNAENRQRGTGRKARSPVFWLYVCLHTYFSETASSSSNLTKHDSQRKHRRCGGILLEVAEYKGRISRFRSYLPHLAQWE